MSINTTNEELVLHYIQTKYKLNELVSNQGLIIYLMNLEDKTAVKTYSEAKAIAREYKGLIYTYASAFCKEKASQAGRNSQQYTILLKQLEEEYQRDKEQVDTNNINIVIQSSDKQTEGEVV